MLAVGDNLAGPSHIDNFLHHFSRDGVQLRQSAAGVDASDVVGDRGVDNVTFSLLKTAKHILRKVN